MAAATVAATGAIGQPSDPRPFLGHITLARLRGSPACGLTERTVAARWSVRQLALVQSEQGPTGARYTTVATLDLL
jgi:2'-5' RNA ligase